jgi:hypothetical protein
MSNIVQCICCCIKLAALLKSEAFIREAFRFHFSSILRTFGAITHLLESKEKGIKQRGPLYTLNTLWILPPSKHALN